MSSIRSSTGKRSIGAGFVVKKRLGSGSTSVALLVERDSKEGVLKVALDQARTPG
jgi:hypothetical protein